MPPEEFFKAAERHRSKCQGELWEKKSKTSVHSGYKKLLCASIFSFNKRIQNVGEGALPANNPQRQ